MVKILDPNEKQALLERTRANIKSAGSREAGLELTRNQLREKGIDQEVKNQFVAGGGELNPPKEPKVIEHTPLDPSQQRLTNQESGDLQPEEFISETKTSDPVISGTPEVTKTESIVENVKAPENIAEWKAQGSNLATLEEMIEGKYGTVAEQSENGTITAKIDGVDYEWKIDSAGNPIKTKVGGENEQDIFGRLMAGEQLPDTGIKETVQYQKANQRKINFDKYSTMDAGSLSLAMENGEILPGTKLYDDLKASNTALLQEAQDLKNANTVNNALSGEKPKTYQEMITQYLMNILQPGEGTDYKKSLSENPQVITLNQKLTKLQAEEAELLDQIENAESDIEKDLDGRSVSKGYKNALIAERTEDLMRAYKLKAAQTGAIAGQLQTIGEDIKYEFDQRQAQRNRDIQNFQLVNSLYQQQQALANQKRDTSVITDASTGNQYLIDSQTGETIRSFGTGLKAGQEAPKLQKIGQDEYGNDIMGTYNEATGKFEPITFSGSTPEGSTDVDTALVTTQLADGTNITATQGTINGIKGVNDVNPNIRFDLTNLYRTQEDQYELFGKGRTVDQLIKAGVPAEYASPDENIVTWTTTSKHMSGNAVDVVLPQGEDKVKYYEKIDAQMAQNGFTRPESTKAIGDYGHYEYTGKQAATGGFKVDSIPQYTSYLTTGKIGSNKEELEVIRREFGSIENFKKQAEDYNNSESGPRTRELEKIQKLKSQVEGIISKENLEALSNSVGTSQFTIALTPQRRKKEAYLAEIQNFLDGKTLQQLIDVKADGATFGALSNEELRMLQNSASKLNQLAIRSNKDDVNQITGFKGSEANFKKVVKETVEVYNELIAKKERLMGKGASTVTLGRIK